MPHNVAECLVFVQCDVVNRIEKNTIHEILARHGSFTLTHSLTLLATDVNVDVPFSIHANGLDKLKIAYFLHISSSVGQNRSKRV